MWVWNSYLKQSYGGSHNLLHNDPLVALNIGYESWQGRNIIKTPHVYLFSNKFIYKVKLTPYQIMETSMRP